MVQLRLESVEDAGMPKDCYVSVRVGESQKISKLSAARNFNFPEARDCRYGKIDVFQRIGSCSVDMTLSEKAGPRDLSIACMKAGFGVLGLKLNVDSGQAAPSASKAWDDGESQRRMEVGARDYLRQHAVEARLSEAMRALLKDPSNFLAQWLTDDAPRQRRRPSDKSAAPAPQPTIPENLPLNSLPSGEKLVVRKSTSGQPKPPSGAPPAKQPPPKPPGAAHSPRPPAGGSAPSPRPAVDRRRSENEGKNSSSVKLEPLQQRSPKATSARGPGGKAVVESSSSRGSDATKQERRPSKVLRLDVPVGRAEDASLMPKTPHPRAGSKGKADRSEQVSSALQLILRIERSVLQRVAMRQWVSLTDGGLLEAAPAGESAARARESDVLRAQAKDALMQAAKSGELAGIVADMKKEAQAAPATQQEELPTGTQEEHAAAAKIQATHRGKLARRDLQLDAVSAKAAAHAKKPSVGTWLTKRTQWNWQLAS